MKKKLLRIFIILFAFTIVAPWLSWGGLYVFAPEKYSEYSAQLSENRELARLEDVNLMNSGNSLSAYIDDHAPFRSLMISLFRKLDGKAEFFYGKVVSSISSLFSKGDDSTTQVVDIATMFGNEDNTTSIPDLDELSKDPVKTHTHNYSLTKELEPTCITSGYKLFTCSDCGAYYSEFLEQLGHDGELRKESTASYTSYGFNEYVCKKCQTVYRTDVMPKLVDTSYLTPRRIGEGILFGRFGWLFYTGNNSISYYKGTNLLSNEKLAEYADTTTRLNDLCKERGIQLYLLFCPNKEQVYSEYMPTYEIDTDYKRTSRLVDYINENTEITAVYPLEELKAADFYWQTYYQYDTHWNNTGAFVGLQALYKAMGRTTINQLELDGETIPAQLNSNFNLGGIDSSNYSPDFEFRFTYKPEITVEGMNSKNVCKMTSDSENSEQLVLLGDSFRIMMLEYLGKDYAKASVAHRDYVASLKKEILKCDVLILQAVERYDARTFTLMDTLIEYFEQDKENSK